MSFIQSTKYWEASGSLHHLPQSWVNFLPQRFVIFAVKHHLPPQKGGIYVEFLSKAFKWSKFKIPPKKVDQRPNPRLPGALSQPHILHLPGTKVGFPPFFGGVDGWTVPYRKGNYGTTPALAHHQASIGISTCNPLADGSGVAGCISCDAKRLSNQGLLSPCLCPTKMIPIATNMGIQSNKQWRLLLDSIQRHISPLNEIQDQQIVSHFRTFPPTEFQSNNPQSTHYS